MIIAMGPATCCYDSALLFNEKLQLRVPCVSLCLIASLVRGAGIKQTCLSITSSASGAGGSLAMSWLNWPRRLAKTHEEMVGLRKSNGTKTCQGWLRLYHSSRLCSVLYARGCNAQWLFSVFSLWIDEIFIIACFVQGPGIKPTCFSITSTSSAIRA